MTGWSVHLPGRDRRSEVGKELCAADAQAIAANFEKFSSPPTEEDPCEHGVAVLVDDFGLTGCAHQG